MGPACAHPARRRRFTPPRPLITGRSRAPIQGCPRRCHPLPSPAHCPLPPAGRGGAPRGGTVAAPPPRPPCPLTGLAVVPPCCRPPVMRVAADRPRLRRPAPGVGPPARPGADRLRATSGGRDVHASGHPRDGARRRFLRSTRPHRPVHAAVSGAVPRSGRDRRRGSGTGRGALPRSGAGQGGTRRRSAVRGFQTHRRLQVAHLGQARHRRHAAVRERAPERGGAPRSRP